MTGSLAHDGVFHHRPLVFLQARRHPVQKALHQFFPTLGQILHHTANAVPGRVHAKSGNTFDHLIAPLPVAERVEHRRHGPQILQVRPEEQQMAGDAEHLRHHHPNHLHPVRHLNTGQFFCSQHIRQVVHHPTGVVNAIGVGNKAVPRLALGHFLGAPVVVANVWHAIDDFLTVQLQHDAESPMGGRVVGPQVEEHEFRPVTLPLHAPGFRVEPHGFLFCILAFHGQGVGIKLGGPGGVILPQRVACPGRRHQYPLRMRVSGDGDAKHVQNFPLVPVGIGEDVANGGHPQIALWQPNLQDQVFITLHRQQVVEHGEVSLWQTVPVTTQALIHGGQVIEHGKRRSLLLQVRQNIDDTLSRHPEYRHARQRGLYMQYILSKIAQQALEVSGACRHRCVCHSLSGVRSSVAWMRWSRHFSRWDGISAR